MPKVSLYTHEQKQLADVTVKEDVLENFANLSGKHLCQNLFLIKLQVSLLKRDFKTGVSCEICIIYKSIYFEENLRKAASIWILDTACFYSLRNNFNDFRELFKGIYLFAMLSEIKSDETFPGEQFTTEEYHKPLKLK